MIKKCDCGAPGCERYVILSHKDYTITQLAELRNELDDFLEKELPILTDLIDEE